MFARSALTLAIALGLNHYAVAQNETANTPHAHPNEQQLKPATIAKLPDIDKKAQMSGQITPSHEAGVAHIQAATPQTEQAVITTAPSTDPQNQISGQLSLSNEQVDTPAQTLDSQTERAVINNSAVADKKTQVSDQLSASNDQNDSPAEAVTPQTAQALKNAEAVVDKLPENQSEPVKTNPVSTDPAVKDWSLDGLNRAEWTTDLGKGQFSVYAKAQVLLNRAHSSPGAIDGISGKNMLKAISAFQVMHGLPVNGLINAETWAALSTSSATDTFTTYTITQEDLDGPYAASIPHDYADQAKMKGLYFTRVTEMLGERFHMDENFLKMLNPNATFKTVGESLIVANVREDLSDPVSLIIAHKGAKQVYAFDSNNKMVASFPATIGSSDTPSPKGTYKVTAVAPDPWYGYNPKNFIQGKNMKPLSLPPGPNNPVGVMWIALSKRSFGIHGTPNPSTISKTASHGCIRLTNWDAVALSKRVQAGVTVKFLE